MDINENLEQLQRLENQRPLLLEALRIKRERSKNKNDQNYLFTHALQEAKRRHPDLAGARPLRMAATSLNVSGPVSVNLSHRVLKIDAANANRKLRDRAIEIQNKKAIDFGDALSLAENEMPELVRTIDQYSEQIASN